MGAGEEARAASDNVQPFKKRESGKDKVALQG